LVTNKLFASFAPRGALEKAQSPWVCYQLESLPSATTLFCYFQFKSCWWWQSRFQT